MKALVKTQDGVRLIHTAELIQPSKQQSMVLVRVDMVGLCRTDLLVAQGAIEPAHTPLILGHEFAGVVEEDPTGKFTKGARVAVNPLQNGSFMGLDINGALCEYVWVPSSHLFATQLEDSRVIAYLEPVAASMAVLKAPHSASKPITAVVGNNRIAHLTWLILSSFGYRVEWIENYNDLVPNHYHTIVETCLNQSNYDKHIEALVPGGTLVLKSRKKFALTVMPAALVAKEITLQAVNYYDFSLSLAWLERSQQKVLPLLGEVYPLENWKEAFNAASSGENKKIFIKI